MTTLDLDALERAARDRVWIWFADNGNIRKWQSECFEEGTEYLSRAEHDRIIAKQAAAARTLQASTLAQVRHLEDKDRSEYVATATLDSERDANRRLTEELLALQERVEGAERVWRPIETAPKDGTWIVAWRGAAVSGTWKNPVTVRWHEWEDGGSWVWPEYQYEVYTDKGRAEADRQIEDADYYEDSKNFTHWRPPPEPPARPSQENPMPSREGNDAC